MNRRRYFGSPSGVTTVFRRQMRARSAGRDLFWTFLLLILLLVVSAVLQRQWAETSIYSGSAPVFLLRWLTLGAAGAAFLFLPCAAVLGAGAAPPKEEFEATQSALLTRLTALDLSLGRLLAALWPVISALLASCAFWLGAQLAYRFVPGAWDGFAPVFMAHLVLLCAVFMVGAIGFLFALRRRPGRLWGVGALAALLWAVGCIVGLFLADRWLGKQPNPAYWIDRILLFNPVTAVTTALNMDVIRADWIYGQTVAHDYDFNYPAPLASAGVFVVIGLIALALAAFRLRHAYR